MIWRDAEHARLLSVHGHPSAATPGQEVVPGRETFPLCILASRIASRRRNQQKAPEQIPEPWLPGSLSIMNWIRGGHKPLMVTIGTRTMADTGSTDCDIKITVTQTYQALSDSKLCAQDWPSPGALGPGGPGALGNSLYKAKARVARPQSESF